MKRGKVATEIAYGPIRCCDCEHSRKGGDFDEKTFCEHPSVMVKVKGAWSRAHGQQPDWWTMSEAGYQLTMNSTGNCAVFKAKVDK